MQAKDIMRKNVITVREELTIQELAKLFIEHRISGAPVVDRQGKLLGVISQTDIVRRDREAGPRSDLPSFYWDTEGPREFSRGFHIEEPELTRVKDVMTPIVLGADEDAPIEDVGRMMLSKRIHRVVITKNGRLAGIVTTMDMLRGLLSLQESSKNSVKKAPVRAG